IDRLGPEDSTTILRGTRRGGFQKRRYFFRDPALRFLGTFAPAFRASLSPMAIACLRLVTRLPDRPDFNVPRLRSCMARSTFSDAFRPYLATTCSLIDVL